MSECKHEEVLNQIADEMVKLPESQFFKVINLLRICASKTKDLRLERDELLSKIEQLQAREAEYAEYVRKLEAVAKAAEEAVPHDYITPELHEALVDWRSNE